uniref:Integrase catalytic domain-containing protein n=1 Tax=Oryza brachyantha TaxID=4533 RepID=J3LRQ0_ORYBR
MPHRQRRCIFLDYTSLFSGNCVLLRQFSLNVVLAPRPSQRASLLVSFDIGVRFMVVICLACAVLATPLRAFFLSCPQIYPPSNKGHKFILAATDYFTKWVEAIPLKKVTSADVINFVKEHIIYRFGIPQTITTDQGSIFVSEEFQQFIAGMGIKLLNSSPYYAQSNGQAEASNKSLIKLIKRKIAKHPRRWHTSLADSL